MNLQNEIELYIEHHRPHLNSIKSYYENLSSLATAIEYGVEGKNPNGKMNNHYRRIGKKKCRDILRFVLEKEPELMQCETFNDIFQVIEEIKKRHHGFGPLWSYDTALRIGFNMKILPDCVYVQSGVKAGFKNLFRGEKIRSRCYPVEKFGNLKYQLKPYEIENFLCVWGNGHLLKKLKPTC